MSDEKQPPALRPDGRLQYEVRPLRVEFGGPLGSCRVRRGAGIVSCTCSQRAAAPLESRPNNGFVRVRCPQDPQLEQLVQAVFAQTQLIPAETLCVTPGREVKEVVLRLQVLQADGFSEDLAVMAAAAAALHLGLEVRLVPSSVVLCAAGEEGQVLADPGQEEARADAGRCLAVLDKSGSLLYLQEQGPVDAARLAEALEDVAAARDACGFVEARAREDVARRQAALRAAYAGTIAQ